MSMYLNSDVLKYNQVRSVLGYIFLKFKLESVGK